MRWLCPIDPLVTSLSDGARQHSLQSVPSQVVVAVHTRPETKEITGIQQAYALRQFQFKNLTSTQHRPTSSTLSSVDHSRSPSGGPAYRYPPQTPTETSMYGVTSPSSSQSGPSPFPLSPASLILPSGLYLKENGTFPVFLNSRLLIPLQRQRSRVLFV